jgi:hypothetical protein
MTTWENKDGCLKLTTGAGDVHHYGPHLDTRILLVSSFGLARPEIACRSRKAAEELAREIRNTGVECAKASATSVVFAE